MHARNAPESIDAELDVLLSLGRGRPLPEAAWCPVHELAAGFARTRPDQIAVQGAGQEVSYAELDAWAGGIAARLAASGAERGSRVAVLAEPSVAMIAAVLGVLKAGAAYVPLDPAQPDRRIAELLADARVAAAVVTEEVSGRLVGSGLPLVCAQGARGEAAPASSRAGLPGRAAPGDPAYLIYTSGSTGEPKGVLVEHGHLAASTLARRLVYPGGSSFLLVSPLAFDSSVAGLWGTLTSGGRLIVAAPEEVRDPERLIELVEKYGAGRLLCVPSLYRVLLDAAERLGVERLRSLETVIVAGESLDESLVERHFALLSSAVALLNEYGPTEATVWASYQRFDRPGPVSIGGPIPGARLYLLDEDLRPVPRGAEGELFIGGAGVSAGYFGRPEATARAFLHDPFAGDGGRMYRTGDLARWNEAGTLDFLGRRDHQVKIRGHRVELDAVEAALRRLPGVRDAAVVPNGAGTQLVGFVVGPAPGAPDSWRRQLAERLPAAMVPARVEVLERFPLTLTGKVDRTALRRAADEDAGRTRNDAGPAGIFDADGGVAAKVAAAWAEVLKQPAVPRDVNFFDLGGHSLAMFQLQEALERHTGTRPSMVALFRHTTVAGQAALIREGPGSASEALPGRRAAAARRGEALRAQRQRAGPVREAAPLPASVWLQCPVPRPDAPQRLVCFPHAGGSASFFREWGRHLPDCAVYAVRYPGRAERIDEPPATDLRRLGREIAEAIAPLADRPLALFGHSMGAAVALETARALEARGVRLAHLFASGSRNGPCAVLGPLAPGDDEPGDADTVRRLVSLGGTDPEAAADPLFQELVLPYIRSDTRLFHSYAMTPGPLLHCPVTTIVGDDDADADSRPWRELTTGEVQERAVAGDHFYLTTAPPYALLREVLDPVADANASFTEMG